MRWYVAVLLILLSLSLARSSAAVDRYPIGGTVPGTIPPILEPVRYLTYCPLHALEGFSHGR